MGLKAFFIVTWVLEDVLQGAIAEEDAPQGPHDSWHIALQDLIECFFSARQVLVVRSVVQSTGCGCGRFCVGRVSGVANESEQGKTSSKKTKKSKLRVGFFFCFFSDKDKPLRQDQW